MPKKLMRDCARNDKRKHFVEASGRQIHSRQIVLRYLADGYARRYKSQDLCAAAASAHGFGVRGIRRYGSCG